MRVLSKASVKNMVKSTKNGCQMVKSGHFHPWAVKFHHYTLLVLFKLGQFHLFYRDIVQFLQINIKHLS